MFPTRPRPTTKPTLLLSLLSLSLLALAFTSPTVIAQPPAAPDAVSPQPAPIYEGLALPSQQVILSAPLDGIVQAIAVDEGDTVQPDQPLVEMDDRLQRVVVEASQLRANSDAEVRRSELVMQEARIMHDRAKQAFEADAASEWEVRRAKLQVEQAQAANQAAVEAKALAQVQLRLEQQRLEQYKLLAPFDGIVIHVRAEVGATVSKADPILSLAKLDPLEAELFLPVELFGQLAVGGLYHLDAAQPVNAQLTGRLKTVDPIIDSASQTFRCVFTIPNPQSKLPAGMLIRLSDLNTLAADDPAAEAQHQPAP
jgi:RND family efflux transporter MFP subunit